MPFDKVTPAYLAGMIASYLRSHVSLWLKTDKAAGLGG
jgi:hypothetical protein